MNKRALSNAHQNVCLPSETCWTTKMKKTIFSKCVSLLLYSAVFVLTLEIQVVKGRPSERGSSMAQYSVETVVIVDEEAYEQWLAIQPVNLTPAERETRAEAAVRDYVAATFRSANLILQGLQEFGILLDARIQDIRIVRGQHVTPGANPRTKKLMDRTALLELEPWLIRNGMEYDHALLLTGYDLVSPSAHVIIEGYAYMHRMCMTESLSVVENTMNGVAAVVFAHELGHALGTYHDGNRDNRCDPRSGFIMNDNNIGISPRRWNYSACSAESIAATLQRLEEEFDCLSPAATWSPPVEGPYLGQLYSADEVCQMTFGNHSYACRHLYGPDKEAELCDILFCLMNSSYCSGKASVDGIVCGEGKRCVAGQCLPFDDVPEGVSDTCPLGDKPGPVWQNRTCNDIVTSFTHNCMDDWYPVSCCASCEDAETGSEVCPYGDAHDQCNTYYCGTEWEDQCCVTCPPEQ